MEKEVDQQLERALQCPVNAVADKIGNCIGKGSHGGEDINQHDEKNQCQRINPIAQRSDESAGLLTDPQVKIAKSDQNKGNEPDDSALLEISFEPGPVLFEGIDCIFAAQHFEHGMIKRSERRTGCYDRHTE